MGFDKETFSTRLRVKRAELKVSQAELSEKAGVNIATINSYENGYYTPMGRAGGLVMGWFVLFMAATGLFAVGWEFGKLR